MLSSISGVSGEGINVVSNGRCCVMNGFLLRYLDVGSGVIIDSEKKCQTGQRGRSRLYIKFLVGYDAANTEVRN
jgi:hypothetical protein